MIEDIHAQLGYKDLVQFINNELDSPTPGRHSEIIEEITGMLPVKNYYCFVQEFFTDTNNYYGVLMVSCWTNKILFIQNGRAAWFNFTNTDCNRLFLMGTTGIAACYSDVIHLYDVVTEEQKVELQITLDNIYGSEIYFAKLRDSNTVVAVGLMQSVLMRDQRLTCYNLKIDLTPYTRIQFRSALNTYMAFDVEVAAGIFEHFSYSSLGETMRVQDTEWSRRSLRKLSAEGIVFINF